MKNRAALSRRQAILEERQIAYANMSPFFGFIRQVGIPGKVREEIKHAVNHFSPGLIDISRVYDATTAHMLVDQLALFLDDLSAFATERGPGKDF